jgi:hypothetical protein
MALYSGQYDPYDPEELKRRQLLAPPEDDLPGAAQVMEPDDTEEEVPASGTQSMTSTVPQLSPGQAKYRQALESMPKSTDFKPSKKRRFLAALAGGLTGIRDPRAGIEVAHSLVSSPFESALGNWKRSVQSAAGEAGIDKEVAAEEVARRRAGAAEVSAQARQRAADATERFRQYQQTHMPWQPTTKEDALEMEGAKHPTKPPTFGGFPTLRDYTTAHPVRPFVNPMDVESQRHRNRMEESSAHDARVSAMRKSIQRQGGTATPEQVNQAEHLAAQQLLRTNPEYTDFYDPGGGKRAARIKSAEEVSSAGGVFGIGGKSETQRSLIREKYRQFLSDLEKKKKQILGTSKSPAGEEDEWDLQQDDEEDNQ